VRTVLGISCVCDGEKVGVWAWELWLGSLFCLPVSEGSELVRLFWIAVSSVHWAKAVWE